MSYSEVLLFLTQYSGFTLTICTLSFVIGLQLVNLSLTGPPFHRLSSPGQCCPLSSKSLFLSQQRTTDLGLSLHLAEVK